MSIVGIKFMVYRLLKSPTFIIQVKDGNIHRLSGNVKSGFKQDCKEIIAASEIKSGIIYASKGLYNKDVLSCSSEMPKQVVQQLRNAFSF